MDYSNIIPIHAILKLGSIENTIIQDYFYYDYILIPSVKQFLENADGIVCNYDFELANYGKGQKNIKGTSISILSETDRHKIPLHLLPEFTGD